MKENRIKAWHFLPDTGLTAHLDTKQKVGSILRHEGEVSICDTGLHASIRAIDALQYAPGSICCKVEVWGDVQSRSDKICGRNRKLLKKVDATKTLHLFAVWCAEQALLAERAAGREPDARSWKALKVKSLWLEGKATNKELGAASNAASSAASTASNAAYAASNAASYAASTASYAASTAAYAAAYAASNAASYAASTASNAASTAYAAYAAYAAYNAAYAASSAASTANSAQNEKLEEMLNELD